MSIKTVASTPAVGGQPGRSDLPPGRHTRAERRENTGSSTEDRRRHQRLRPSGLQVSIQGRNLPVKDISIGGFRIEPYAGDLSVGDVFPLTFRVVLDGAITEFRGKGSAVRRDSAGLVAVYMTPDPRFYHHLSRYLEGTRALMLSYAGTRPATATPAFLKQDA